MGKLFDFDSTIYVESRQSDLSYAAVWFARGALIAAMFAVGVTLLPASFLAGPTLIPAIVLTIAASTVAGLMAELIIKGVIDTTFNFITAKPEYQFE